MYKRFLTGKRVKAALITYIGTSVYSVDDRNSFLHNIYTKYVSDEIHGIAGKIEESAKAGNSDSILEQLEIFLCKRFIERVRGKLLQAEFHSLKKTGRIFTQNDVDKLCDIFQDFIIDNRPNPIID